VEQKRTGLLPESLQQNKEYNQILKKDSSLLFKITKFGEIKSVLKTIIKKAKRYDE